MVSLVWLEGEIDSKLFWVFADRQTDEWTMVILEVLLQLKSLLQRQWICTV